MSVLEKIVVLKLNDKKDEFTTVPKDMQDEVIKRVGSEFRPGTRDCIRGLSPEEERVILPNIVGLNPTDQQFPARVRDYWADYSVMPTVEGIKLNIATEQREATVNGTKVMLDLPINEEDYITYKFCMQSSKVAKTKEQLSNLGQYDFYLVNLEEEKEKAMSEFTIKKDSDIAFGRLVTKFPENEDKVNWILQMIKKPQEHFSESMSQIEKEMMLSKKKDESPVLFLNIANDVDLEQKAFLSKAIAFGIMTIEGYDYFNGDKNLGPEKSAISKLKSPEFSSELLTIQARLQGAVESVRK